VSKLELKVVPVVALVAAITLMSAMPHGECERRDLCAKLQTCRTPKGEYRRRNRRRLA
jgi:hypothetical protein